MARKRFTAIEKAAYTVGAADIEYRNGSHWHPAQIVGPIAIDSIGNPYLPMRVTVTTKTLSPEWLLQASPSNVRVRTTYPTADGGRITREQAERIMFGG